MACYGDVKELYPNKFLFLPPGHREFEPQSTQRARRKRKAFHSALRVLCGSNSNLSTCINPHVYRAFKLKSVPLIYAQLPGAFLCTLLFVVYVQVDC